MPEPGRETQPYVTFRDQAPVDAAVADLAAVQHAVFALDQLAVLGLSSAAVRKRAAAGRLHRVYRGIYSLVPSKLLTREGRWMAAVLACGRGAVLSHRSAAALLGLRTTNRARIDVTVPARATRKHSGVDVHRSTTLTPSDTTRIRNIPSTTIARTQLDIAGVIDRRGVERVFDQAEILQLLDRKAIEDQLARNPTHRGNARTRAVLDQHYPGRTVSASELEERFLALIRDARLPHPEMNAWVVLPGAEPAIRVDFVWRERRIVVETDGHQTHRTRWAFEGDRRRDQLLTAAGWRPVRVTWRQVEHERNELIATLAALMR